MSGAWRIAGAAALVLAVHATATGVRIARELRSHRRDRTRLAVRWTQIAPPPGCGTGRPLHVRALTGRGTPPPGLPVVLLHGYGIGSSYLVPLAARLAAHGPVHVPELPGHGASARAPRPLDVEGLAAAAEAWMTANAIEDAVLVGHSLGCQVAAEVAARRPDRVRALVLVGPTCDARGRRVRTQLLRALRGGAHERPSFAVWTARDYPRAGGAVLAGELRAMVAHRIERPLVRLRIPVRVIRGARDPIAPQRWAERVARIAGAPPPIVVPRWGHAVHYDAPEAVADVVRALARTPAAAH